MKFWKKIALVSGIFKDNLQKWLLSLEIGLFRKALSHAACFWGSRPQNIFCGPLLLILTTCMLSPVPSFTSEPTPCPLIFLIPYLFMFQLLSSYLLCSVLFIPAYSFCPTLSYYHAIDSHVVPFPSCSRIMCWCNLMFVRSLLPWTPVPVPAPPHYLRTPPVFKPAVSIDTKQYDYFTLFLPLTPISARLCLTSIQLRPLTLPEIIGHTANRMSGCNT